MKIHVGGAIFLSLALVAAIRFAEAQQYETGKIVKVEKLESHSSSGGTHPVPSGTDTPLKAEVATYSISIQLGDTMYVCKYKSHADTQTSWTEGKDVQARISGKAMYVKTDAGTEQKIAILSTSPARNP